MADLPRETNDPAPDIAPVDGGADRWLGKLLSDTYLIEKKLGEGGMGLVYIASHIRLQKQFALKMLPESLAKDENSLLRLSREAMAASRVEHPGVVQVFGLERTGDGSLYIVMELLRGKSLREYLHLEDNTKAEDNTLLAAELDSSVDRPASIEIKTSKQLPIDEACQIALQAADTLASTHAANVMHRDLKPDNIFLMESLASESTQTTGGERNLRVKILDFGVSKRLSEENPSDVALTRTGHLVGTPLYMSPEQARGDDQIDERADIYSLSVVLFEMLTGRTPFVGKNAFQLLWKHGHDVAPEASRFCPNLPPALNDFLAKGLAKQPSDRFATMREFSEQLIAAQKPSHAGAHSRATKTTWLRTAVVVATLLAALVFVLGVLMAEPSPHEPDTRATNDLGPSMQPSKVVQPPSTLGPSTVEPMPRAIEATPTAVEAEPAPVSPESIRAQKVRPSERPMPTAENAREEPANADEAGRSSDRSSVVEREFLP